jgi:hypothetical protein
VFVTLGGFETTSVPVAEGNVSLKLTPVRFVERFALLIVNVTVAMPFNGIVAALNALLMVGADTTFKVAVLLIAPVPPLVELTAPVVLDTVPATVPVTFTERVQVDPGVVMPPLDRLMLVVPAVAVTVPPHVLLTPGAPATCRPFVSVSLKAMPFSAVVLAAGLVMVNVTVVVPFSGMLAAPKAFEIVGGATTLMVAVLLVAPVPPSVELIVLVVLLASPAAVPVTLTLNVHDAF